MGDVAERTRGGAWLELLNPSQVFGDIMVDYSHVECTSAVVQALALAKRRFPDLRDATSIAPWTAARSFSVPGKGRTAASRARGRSASRRAPGSASPACSLAGARPDDEAILRACSFLLDRQHVDGGWGEDAESCREHRYIQAQTPGVTQTSWALSALVCARAIQARTPSGEPCASWWNGRSRAEAGRARRSSACSTAHASSTTTTTGTTFRQGDRGNGRPEPAPRRRAGSERTSSARPRGAPWRQGRRSRDARGWPRPASAESPAGRRRSLRARRRPGARRCSDEPSRDPCAPARRARSATRCRARRRALRGASWAASFRTLTSCRPSPNATLVLDERRLHAPESGSIVDEELGQEFADDSSDDAAVRPELLEARDTASLPAASAPSGGSPACRARSAVGVLAHDPLRGGLEARELSCSRRGARRRAARDTLRRGWRRSRSSAPSPRERSPRRSERGDLPTPRAPGCARPWTTSRHPRACRRPGTAGTRDRPWNVWARASRGMARAKVRLVLASSSYRAGGMRAPYLAGLSDAMGVP